MKMKYLKRLGIIALLLVVFYFGPGLARGLRYDLFGSACQKGNPFLVGLLLSLDADPNGGPHYYYSGDCREPRLPLGLASEGGHLGVVRKLLRAGARPDFYEGEGISALDYTIFENHPDVAKALLDAGAPTGERNGGAPLYTAKAYHRTEIVALLEHHKSQ